MSAQGWAIAQRIEFIEQLSELPPHNTHLEIENAIAFICAIACCSRGELIAAARAMRGL